jgi:hypothetical protein
MPEKAHTANPMASKGKATDRLHPLIHTINAVCVSPANIRVKTKASAAIPPTTSKPTNPKTPAKRKKRHPRFRYDSRPQFSKP